MPDASKTLEEHILSTLVAKNLVTHDLAVSKKLRDAVLKLSDAFTRERAELPPNYFDDETNRLAYLAGFVLANAAKIASCLEQILGLLPGKGPLSILDVGAGPGTAVFAASSFFYDREVGFVAIEANRRILDTARSLGRLLPDSHGVEWVAGNVEILPNNHFDIAIAANVLNELGPEEQLRACKKLLSTSKILIVIDPALKQTTRSLMALRDQIVDGAHASVVAPCTHQNPCPMLAANQRDWCHFYLEWQRPKLLEALDNATGLDHCYLKMAYLILKACHSDRPANDLWRRAEESLAVKAQRARDPSTEPALSERSESNGLGMTNKTIYRVVSSPLRSKGKLELIVCGKGELKRLRRLDKNASKTNAAFDAATRGDLIEFTEKERPGEIRALDDVELVAPFLHDL
jgi:ribosomal protein RSM22 (predicted rRNA methylase)